MIVKTDTLYLPVLAPRSVDVRYDSLPSRRPTQVWQQRVYRIPRIPRPQAESIAYGADGNIKPAYTSGKLIDIFA